MATKYEHISILSHLMYPEVIQWLKSKIKDLLVDYLTIKQALSRSNIIVSDYSYLITPAFKALEGTLLQIGEELGFDVKKYKYIVGVIFNDENLEKYYSDVLEKIKHLTEENKVDVKQWLDNARRILKSLRHTPAHYEGEIKDHLSKAFLSGDLIIATINEMCRTLIDNNLFPSLVAEREEEARIEQKRINGTEKPM